MPLIITRPLPPPDGSDPKATAAYVVGALADLLRLIQGLYSLDKELREVRTLAAERGVLYNGLVITNAAPTLFRIAIPDTVTKNFTTALIKSDAGSGAGRYRYDGGSPAAAATSAAGIPLANGGDTVVITGAENISSFSIIAETATAIQLSVMLHQ